MRRYSAILILILVTLTAHCHSGGLLFYGNEKRFSERSAFNLTKERSPLVASDSLVIEFFYRTVNTESPGYIMHLEDEKNDVTFGLNFTAGDDEGTISLVEDGKKLLAACTVDRLTLKHGVPVRIAFYPGRDSVSMRIGEFTGNGGNLGLDKPFLRPEVIFGMHGHVLETASFTLSDLSLTADGKTIGFPLDESDGTAVHDLNGKVTGEVTNPTWLINNSYYWHEIFSHDFSSPAGCVFAPGRDSFIMYTGDSLLIYDIPDKKLESRKLEVDGSRWFTRLGMGFYDDRSGRLLPYELNSGATIVSEIDIEKGRGRVIDYDNADLQLHHHAAVFLPGSRRMLFMGGYGNRKYFNDFITYDLKSGKWETLVMTGDIITPRFFVSMALAPDGKTLYVYGGKGNAMGNQDIGVEYFYDLYRVDLETLTVKRLWEQEAPEVDRVPTRNMILSPDGDYLYFMAYPEYHPHSELQLYRMAIADGVTEKLGDTVPIESEEIASNAGLYLDSAGERLLCVVQEYKVVVTEADKGKNRVAIYMIDFPPVSEADMNRYVNRANSLSPWWLTALLPVILIFLFLKMRRKPGETAGKEEESAVISDGTDEPQYKPVNNSLMLFGQFTAIDKDGRDISYMFSPKNRQLFVYLLINSIEKEGVQSSHLNNLFWPDKTEDKIKNLKNVSINKIRKIIQEWNGVELVYNKGYFRVNMDKDFYCDYAALYRLTFDFTISGVNDETDRAIDRIIYRGRFLSSLEVPQFDSVRQRVESFEVTYLTENIGRNWNKKDYKAVLSACNALREIDSLSEPAMRYTVMVSKLTGDVENGRRVYSAYARKYLKIMGTPCGVSLEEI